MCRCVDGLPTERGKSTLVDRNDSESRTSFLSFVLDFLLIRAAGLFTAEASHSRWRLTAHHLGL